MEEDIDCRYLMMMMMMMMTVVMMMMMMMKDHERYNKGDLGSEIHDVTLRMFDVLRITSHTG